ncbi:MAG: hypothetical protein PVG65_01220 [Candidatus Thorarchaeota archaeon]
MDLLTEFLRRMIESVWFDSILALLAVSGFVMAIIIYLKSRRQKSPVHSTRSINIAQDIIPNRFESLELSYNGVRIENFTITKVLFWNDGKETIHLDDIAQEDPLEIFIADDARILDIRVIQRKPLTNGFEVNLSDDQSSAMLGFDYIDKDEGAVIQVIHTGRSGKEISLRGRVAGAGNPTYREFTEVTIPGSIRYLFRNISINQYRRLIAAFFILVAIFLAYFFQHQYIFSKAYFFQHQYIFSK